VLIPEGRSPFSSSRKGGGGQSSRENRAVSGTGRAQEDPLRRKERIKHRILGWTRYLQVLRSTEGIGKLERWRKGGKELGRKNRRGKNEGRGTWSKMKEVTWSSKKRVFHPSFRKCGGSQGGREGGKMSIIPLRRPGRERTSRNFFHTSY